MRRKIQLTSFENASLLRKLTILYFLMSIMPVLALYFLYLQLRDYGRLVITEESFSGILALIVCGVAVGYVVMRSQIMRIIDITRANRESLKGILGPEKIRALTGEGNELAVLARSFNEIVGRLEENVRNLELAKKTLHSVLSRVGEGISVMDNIDSFLHLILETVTDALQGQEGLLLLRETGRPDLFVKTVYGEGAGHKKGARVVAGKGPFQEVLALRGPLVLERVPREGGLAGLFQAPVLCAPLLLHDRSLGVIAVCGRRSEAPYDDEEKNLLFNLALQTAVAIENSRLNEDAERTYFETISALAMAVEAKDPYSRGHLDRVAQYATAVARRLNVNEEEIKVLRDAAKLHDLGKIGVVDGILKKEGALTAQEMEAMKRHCEIGEGILKPIRSLRPLCDIVRHHHEKLDGTGYPDGLKGDEIRPLVRILAVADIFDALTTNRPYRKAFTREQALEMMRGMKDQIDPKMVEALAAVVA